MKTKLISLIFLLTIFAFNVYAQDDAKKNEELKNKIIQAYDTFNKYEFDKMDEYIDVNYIEHTPDPGQKQGLEGLKEAFTNMKKGYPDYKLTVNDIIVNGDKASVLVTFTGTNSGEFMGMKPTGKSVNVQGIDYLYFKNSKATDHWGFIDVNKLMQQLGMMPEK